MWFDPKTSQWKAGTEPISKPTPEPPKPSGGGQLTVAPSQPSTVTSPSGTTIKIPEGERTTVPVYSGGGLIGSKIVVKMPSGQTWEYFTGKTEYVPIKGGVPQVSKGTPEPVKASIEAGIAGLPKGAIPTEAEIVSASTGQPASLKITYTTQELVGKQVVEGKAVPSPISLVSGLPVGGTTMKPASMEQIQLGFKMVDVKQQLSAIYPTFTPIQKIETHLSTLLSPYGWEYIAAHVPIKGGVTPQEVVLQRYTEAQFIPSPKIKIFGVEGNIMASIQAAVSNPAVDVEVSVLTSMAAVKFTTTAIGAKALGMPIVKATLTTVGLGYGLIQGGRMVESITSGEPTKALGIAFQTIGQIAGGVAGYKIGKEYYQPLQYKITYLEKGERARISAATIERKVPEGDVTRIQNLVKQTQVSEKYYTVGELQKLMKEPTVIFEVEKVGVLREGKEYVLSKGEFERYFFQTFERMEAEKPDIKPDDLIRFINRMGRGITIYETPKVGGLVKGEVETFVPIEEPPKEVLPVTKWISKPPYPKTPFWKTFEKIIPEVTEKMPDMKATETLVKSISKISTTAIPVISEKIEFPKLFLYPSLKLPRKLTEEYQYRVYAPKEKAIISSILPKEEQITVTQTITTTKQIAIQQPALSIKQIQEPIQYIKQITQPIQIQEPIQVPKEITVQLPVQITRPIQETRIKFEMPTITPPFITTYVPYGFPTKGYDYKRKFKMPSRLRFITRKGKPSKFLPTTSLFNIEATARKYGKWGMPRGVMAEKAFWKTFEQKGVFMEFPTQQQFLSIKKR
jgi:hypothetical protein